MKTLLLSTLAFFGLYTPGVSVPTSVPSTTQDVISVYPTTVPLDVTGFSVPTTDFFSRITKKPFGAYITPQTSPVSPEKFSGFHTGTDAEYEDISSEVSVNTIYSGKIIYSGWVSGYGGVVAQSISYNSQDYVVIYGHLSPTSLSPVKSDVKAGQKIGILGRGYSSETDGERRHLHLAIVKGSKLNLRGYVPNQSQLSSWLNPVDFLNTR